MKTENKMTINGYKNLTVYGAKIKIDKKCMLAIYKGELYEIDDDFLRELDRYKRETKNKRAENKEKIDALTWLASAMSKDATRYVLNGVFFDVENECCVATDGRQMRIMKVNPSFFGVNKTCIIYDHEVMRAIKNYVFIDTRYTIYGNFPNYRQVIPHDDQIKHEFDFDISSVAIPKLPKTLMEKHRVFFDTTKNTVFFGDKSNYGDGIVGIDPNFLDKFNGVCKIRIIDELTPIILQQGEKMSVIMPKRC